MKTHLDLFSGIGGFALAAQSTGWQTIGFSEIEPYACKILKQHWPDVPNYGDIRNVHGIRADLVTGGFPCQPFSNAGKRRGAQDDRSLWPEMLRIIEETRPRWMLGENVPGIVSLELDRMLADLENIGYSAWPIAIPACAVDARHKRERIWIVANSDSAKWWQEHTKAGEIQRRNDANSLHEWAEIPNGLDACRSSMANSIGSRLEVGKKQSALEERSAIKRDCNPPASWPAESGVRRVAHGIPNRVDRLRGLGNAIVPQVAEVILRAIAKIYIHDPMRT